MKTNLICVLLLSFFLVKMDAFAQKAVIKVACIGKNEIVILTVVG